MNERNLNWKPSEWDQGLKSMSRMKIIHPISLIGLKHEIMQRRIELLNLPPNNLKVEDFKRWGRHHWEASQTACFSSISLLSIIWYQEKVLKASFRMECADFNPLTLRGKELKPLQLGVKGYAMRLWNKSHSIESVRDQATRHLLLDQPSISDL